MKNPPASPESDHAAGPSDNPNASHIRLRIAENDALIRSRDLDNGDEIVRLRTAIYTTVIAEWVAAEALRLNFCLPFALGAIGGTGRQEVTPCSDLDIVFLFEAPVSTPEIHDFVVQIQNQVNHTKHFRSQHGFYFDSDAFSLADAGTLKAEALNSLLDLEPLLDEHGLCEKFRAEIRAKFDPFQHFLHVRQFWSRRWESAGARSERIKDFDIKNDGLRLFLSGVWTLAGATFESCREVYRRVDPRVLDAYRFLLRVRSWVHLHRPSGGVPNALGTHREDMMTFSDFDGFGKWLGPEASDEERMAFADEVRARLLDGRRRIAGFARGVISAELRPGRPIKPGHPICLGAGGLFHTDSNRPTSDLDRSHAALDLIRTSQKYEVPIDPSELITTFKDAGDWLHLLPQLGELFRETTRGLAPSFDFLSQIPGVEEKLFLGYGKFESSIDQRVRTEQTMLRGPLEREKMRTLDAHLKEGQHLQADSLHPERLTDVAFQVRIEVETAQLTPHQLAGLRLALKTKRLPVTATDLQARDDPALPLADRFASGFSGIPVESYYDRYVTEAGFSKESIDLARFLVENRRTLRELAETGINDEAVEAELLRRCGHDPVRLRALYVFTLTDRHAWESVQTHPARFFNILEIYAKARMPEHRRFDPRRQMRDAGCHDAESHELLLDFGRDLFTGIYRHDLIRFMPFLLAIAGARDPGRSKPKAMMVKKPPFCFLGVAAPDRRGMAASIAGALWKNGLALEQAHLFSATNRRLALDFFHLVPPPPGKEWALPDGKICQLVEKAIVEGEHLSGADETALPDLARRVRIAEMRPGLHRIQAESDGNAGALIYLLCLKAFRHLDADVHGLTAQTSRGGSHASVFVKLPKGKEIDHARQIVENWG